MLDLIRVLWDDQRRDATYSLKSHSVLIALDNSIDFGVKTKSIDVQCEGRRISSMPVHEALDGERKLCPIMEASVDSVRCRKRSYPIVVYKCGIWKVFQWLSSDEYPKSRDLGRSETRHESICSWHGCRERKDVLGGQTDLGEGFRYINNPIV